VTAGNSARRTGRLQKLLQVANRDREIYFRQPEEGDWERRPDSCVSCLWLPESPF
jgi:hypothetical protein